MNRRILAARGMVPATYHAETGEHEHDLTPVWTLRSAYWRRMTFPANGETKVHHEYTPAVGEMAKENYWPESDLDILFAVVSNQ